MVLALAGCSQAPDWADPGDWFDDMFNDDVEQLPPAPQSSAKTPGADKPYPKLSETQAPTNTGSSAQALQDLTNSLVADRDNAKYTKQDLRAVDQRVAAAPPPPPQLIPTPEAKAKSAAPKRIEDVSPKRMAAMPASEGTAPRSELPSLPAAPTRMAASSGSDSGTAASGGFAQVPSIVQRRGSALPPPPPTPVAEVSRLPIPQIVQKGGGDATGQQAVGTAALPQPPAAVAPAPAVARPEAPRLMPPTAQGVPQLAAQGGAAMAPSVQVNLQVGQDQSILAQTFAASVAAQGSSTVRQPGNVFYASNATPIGGQWPTIVPGVVQQAFNTSLNNSDRGVPAVQGSVIASPQMSNDAMRRLPGAPGLIRFGHGSTRLSGKEKKYLKNIAKQAQTEGKMVYVVGHASQRTGDMDYAKHKLVNFNLSLDRANAVAGELRRRGVASDRIVVQAKGDADPLYFEFMPDGEAQNRRVEVFIR
jgi:outer membrane protein OmpA-like peptidoglycan-associated protein